MMKKSSMCSRHEIEHHNGNEFDPETDFAVFLEEAKIYADSKKFYEEGAKKQQSEDRRSKKSWKTALFSFWGTGKKGGLHMEQPRDKHLHDHTASPLHQKDCSGAGESRRHCPTSGPISTLFSPRKRMQNGIPYASLEKLTRPQADQAFGPVYKVT